MADYPVRDALGQVLISVEQSGLKFRKNRAIATLEGVRGAGQPLTAPGPIIAMLRDTVLVTTGWNVAVYTQVAADEGQLLTVAYKDGNNKAAWAQSLPEDVPDAAIPVVIDYSKGPSSSLTTVTAGDTVNGVLTALDEGDPVASDGSTVSVSRKLFIGGVEASGVIAEGNVLVEARFTASAVGAEDVTVILPLGITADAEAPPPPPPDPEPTPGPVTISYSAGPPNGPTSGILSNVQHGDSVSAILASLNQGNPVASDGSAVTVTRALFVGGAAVTGVVSGGTVLQEARFTASAAGATAVTVTLPLNITVQAAPVVTDPNAEVYTLAQVEALKTDRTITGTQWGGAYKNPRVDALPTGVSVGSQYLDFGSGAPAVFEGWDISDLQIRAFSGCNTVFQNNIVREVAGIVTGKNVLIERDPGANFTIRKNTFVGAMGALVYVGGGVGSVIIDDVGGTIEDPTLPNPAPIEYNRFYGFGADIYKGGVGPCRRNYFGPPVNLPYKPTVYSATTTYQPNEIVWHQDNGRVYYAKVQTLGNALPTSKTSNTQWQNVDPHADQVNPRNRTLTNAQLVIENHIERNIAFGVDGEIASGAWGIGATNGVRCTGNSGDQRPVGGVTVIRNLVTAGFDGISPGLEGATQGDQPRFTPNTFQDNWVEPTNGGLLFHPSAFEVGNTIVGTKTYVRGQVAPAAPAPAGPLVAAVIGQSENEVGFSINTTYYTSGPYPTLLSGVDAQIALQAASNKGGQDGIRTLNQAAITAKDVNPGFVALANLWHVGSGGRPLRLVDVAVPGTGPDAMLDVQNTGRNTAADLSIIAHAQASFGPIQRVTYNWFNGEAGVAKTLRESRSPHLIGRNADGTPYDFASGAIDYCVIDTTGRGFGMFPDTAKLDLMLIGPTVDNGQTIISPPHKNYRYKADGTDTHGRINQNGAEAIAERKAFVASIPVENRGRATILSSLCQFGDYQGGAKLPGNSQTLIHPAQLTLEGQVRFSQLCAASLLISEGHLKPSRHVRTEFASDGSYAEMVFEMANGGTLTTQRKRGYGDPITTPRPHQHADGMGFVIYRTGDDKRSGKPLYRADQTNNTLYPTAYRGTVQITDTGTFTNGKKEARVRVTPVQPFAAGETLLFGDDGGYGVFILHGFPDYDAHMQHDCLIEHIPSLASADFPGLPIEPQVTSVVGAAAAVEPEPVNPTPEPPPAGEGADIVDFYSIPVKNNAGYLLSRTDKTITGTTQGTAGVQDRLSWATSVPQTANRTNIAITGTVRVSQPVKVLFRIAANDFLSSAVTERAITFTPATPGVAQDFVIDSTFVNPGADSFIGMMVETVTSSTAIKFTNLRILDMDGVAEAPPPPAPTASHFTFAAAGPYIKAPATIGTGKVKARFQIEMRVPAAVTPANGARLLAQGSIGCDLRFATDAIIGVLGIEDNGPTPNQVLGATSILTFPKDTWFILDVTVDHAANTLFVSSDLPGDDVLIPFTKTSTGEFQSGREFGFFTALPTIGSLATAGVQVRRARLWFNDATTPYIDVDATTINTHPWKGGDNAVITT